MEQIQQLSIGSMVYLRSGSPKLEVVAVEDNQVTVEWLADDGEPQSWTLPEGCFVPAGNSN